MNLNLHQIIQNADQLHGVEGGIIGATQGNRASTLLMTSCRVGEGKTTSSVTVAYAISSQVKAKVLLVDCNFQSPMISTLFNISASPGFSDLVLSKIDAASVIKKTSFDNLSVIPHGSTPSYTLELFRKQEFKEKLAELEIAFDYVIFDGPSTLEASEISLISMHFDGTILVVECEKTRWEVVEAAKERIRSAGGKVLGVVLNKRSYYIPESIYERI